jgi:hypothetical protein
MNVRHSRLGRLLALTVVVSMPLLGMAGVASAKTSKAAPNCIKHPNRPKCSGGGSTTGGGTGGPTVNITVEVDPGSNVPLVETGQSEVHAVIQVETLPSFAGDMVNIDSSQLDASCNGGITFTSVAGAPTTTPPLYGTVITPHHISVVLDDDGNATVFVDGYDCAPGTDVVEADLEVAPFYTALTTLTVAPPAVTPVGLSAFPTIGGVQSEVETGDTSTSGDSNVYAVFYVETNPVYAEQQVEISSAQLEGRCVRAWAWAAGNQNGAGVITVPPNSVDGQLGGVNTQAPVNTFLDDDGNAVFEFAGVSCAAGPSEVIADVLAGTHDTFTTTFTVDPPAPTI